MGSSDVRRPDKSAFREQWMAVAREALTGEVSSDLPGDKKFEWSIRPTEAGDPGELRVQPPPQSSAAAFATAAASAHAQATDPHHIACIPGSSALVFEDMSN